MNRHCSTAIQRRTTAMPFAHQTMKVVLMAVCLAANCRGATLSFSNYVVLATGSWPEAVAIEDLDGDGRNDVVLGTSSYFNTNDNSILIFFQSLSGQLAAPVRYAVGASAASVTIADFSGDGLPDIAVGKNQSGIRVFWQDTGGIFQRYTDYETPNSYRICSSDFNGDGCCDVAGIG
jgi:hypothetical protein